MRAKFRLDNKMVNQFKGGSNVTAVFNPVYSNDPGNENHKFWQATPAGKIELAGLKDETANSLIIGQEYYVDITSAT